jgi:hypothetical protein
MSRPDNRLQARSLNRAERVANPQCYAIGDQTRPFTLCLKRLRIVQR